MTGHDTTCAKCGQAMEPGFVLDRAQGGMMQSTWVDGEPERSVWTGIKVKGHEQLSVITYRCRNCGYLEAYAHPE